jgi:hypothetical protein
LCRLNEEPVSRHPSIWPAALCLALAATFLATPASAQWRYPGYYVTRDLTAVRVMVTPRQAKVYVDGYYAGIVDDFDGVFQRLHAPAGAHEITLYLDGYRTVTQKIYLTPDETYKLHYTMEKNLAGEASEPPPAPPEPPQPPARTQPPPRRPPYPPAGYPPYPPYPPRQPYPPQAPPPPEQPPAEGQPQQPQSMEASDAGTLLVRVQPSGADVFIDGERWRGPEGDERLIVQVSEGSHHVEVRKDGYRSYAGDVDVKRGETRPVNVSLTPERN